MNTTDLQARCIEDLRAELKRVIEERDEAKAYLAHARKDRDEAIRVRDEAIEGEERFSAWYSRARAACALARKVLPSIATPAVADARAALDAVLNATEED